jgi:hypothetical protein
MLNQSFVFPSIQFSVDYTRKSLTKIELFIKDSFIDKKFAHDGFKDQRHKDKLVDRMINL